MRIAVLVLASFALSAMVAAPRASADPPVVVLDTIHITSRGPTVFTTISRSPVERPLEELRADLVREVPRTVQRHPF